MYSVLLIFAIIGALSILGVLFLGFHVFPSLDFTRLEIQFSDSTGRNWETYDLSSVQAAQAHWAWFGVKMGLIVLDDDVPLGSGASKYLELAVPGLNSANVKAERVHYSNSGFYIREGEYFEAAALGSDPFSKVDAALALARAKKVQENAEPSALTRVYCLANANQPGVRCASECRKIFAPESDAGYMQKIAYSLECLGAPSA